MSAGQVLSRIAGGGKTNVDELALCCAWRERTLGYLWGSTHFSGDNDLEQIIIIIIIIILIMIIRLNDNNEK